ncbi:MAG: thiamine phosphate synthase [Hydrogenophilales bacterium CG17_big_fil_post_rev_8_21_14_2_50_63_12]|nr:MAG: thiamine phosphate synthase [Hydrogenophilales bacterium CG17_big_fil_post_rev_8_21_14_2_50_63_12]PIX96120.1 MAG: thiamine phosphate synthase [Hydrogenophilales bacterium CG_4_10_14_3_um_filter_63_21]PJB04618.1 MAG: thiamine phosphate synthase [Hydrogenophilales bacterium CG_4_9_14_3_um_filter_63_34]
MKRRDVPPHPRSLIKPLPFGISRPRERGGSSTAGAEFRLQGLYAITPDWAETRRLLAATEAILAAGCRILQYRNKAASDRHRQEQAVALRGLTRRFNALLIINDDVELALFAEADGVHLGEDDGELAAARERLGSAAILGATCYQSLNLARSAARAGADYLAFGSFFASFTKPLARRADTALLETVRAEIDLPLCAIGGITLDNAALLLAAGAEVLAVITALYDAADPAAATRQFIQLFEEKS